MNWERTLIEACASQRQKTRAESLAPITEVISAFDGRICASRKNEFLGLLDSQVEYVAIESSGCELIAEFSEGEVGNREAESLACHALERPDPPWCVVAHSPQGVGVQDCQPRAGRKV